MVTYSAEPEDPILTVDVDGLIGRTALSSFLVWWTTPPHVAVDRRLRATPRIRAWRVWSRAVELTTFGRPVRRLAFLCLRLCGADLLVFAFRPRAFLPRPDAGHPGGGPVTVGPMIPASAGGRD